MKNMEDGRYTHAIHELLIDQDDRNTVNTNPVRNCQQIFSQAYPPTYVNDSGSMSTKKLNELAADEASRKTAVKLLKCDMKGMGPDHSIARENNGDIVRWTKIGGAMVKEGDRYANPKQKPHKVHEMQSASTWSSDLKTPTPRNRKDFVGNGNIISWM